MNLTRIKAAAIHLLISICIAALITALILLIWYPYPLFKAVGGQVLLPMIIGVDVCLGPLLTLVIYNPKKARKLIVLDLTIIGIVQMSALLYGMYAAFEGRPVFVAYAQERFIIVPANALDDGMLQDAQDPRYRTAPPWGPTWVGTKMPTAPREISDLNFYQGVAGLSIHYQPKYYVDLNTQHEELARVAKPLKELIDKHPEASAKIEQVTHHTGEKIDNIGYLPLLSKQSSMSALISKKTGAVLDMLDVEPK